MNIGYFDDCYWLQSNIDRLTSTGRFRRLHLDEGDGTIDTLIHPMRRLDLSRFPGLVRVASNTTGPHFIDTEYCASHDIKVITLQSDRTLQRLTCTAEHTLGLIFAAHRRLVNAHEGALYMGWERWSHAAPKMLSEMTLGIVGNGRIGRMLDTISYKIFGKVITHDKSYCTHPILLRLVKESDVLAITCAYTPETHDMINANILSHLPLDAIVVNTARGEIVDCDALLYGLETGSIRAAGFDVLPGEFDPVKPPIYKKMLDYARRHHNLILTPHIAGSTQTAWDMTQKRIIELLREESGK